MQTIIDMLHQKGCSCVIRKGLSIRCFSQRGVADLYALRSQDPAALNHADIADKVIGKGAAALLLMGGISRVYADVISDPAFELLQDGGVSVAYGNRVPHIINRNRTGWCPLEKLCESARTAEECLPLIENFIQTIQKR